MEVINPNALRGDEYLKAFSASGEALIRVVDGLRPPWNIVPIDTPDYRLMDSDHGKIIDCMVACRLVVTTNLREGFRCKICQGGEEQVHVVAGRGVLMESPGGLSHTESQFVVLDLVWWAPFRYRLFGRLA